MLFLEWNDDTGASSLPVQGVDCVRIDVEFASPLAAAILNTRTYISVSQSLSCITGAQMYCLFSISSSLITIQAN